jgi:SAM-dependent methyltransferase
MKRDIRAELEDLYKEEDPFGYHVRNRWPVTAGICAQLMKDRIGNFCEIGCGEGGLLRHLNEAIRTRSFGCYGVEISKTAASRAIIRTESAVRTMDVLDAEARSKLQNKVDLCVVSDFFELVAEPKDTMEVCSMLQKEFVLPGGTLLVTGVVPESGCFQYPHVLLGTTTVLEGVIRVEVYNRREKKIEFNSCVYRAYKSDV